MLFLQNQISPTETQPAVFYQTPHGTVTSSTAELHGTYHSKAHSSQVQTQTLLIFTEHQHSKHIHFPRFTPVPWDEFSTLPSFAALVVLQLCHITSPASGSNISDDKSYCKPTHMTRWQSSHITSMYSACWIPLAEELLRSTRHDCFPKVEN